MNERKPDSGPLVFIIGGTGDSLTNEQKSFDFKKYMEKRELLTQLESKASSLKEYQDLRSRLSDNLSQAIEKKLDETGDQYMTDLGLADKEKLFSDHTDLRKLSDKITALDHNISKLRNELNINEFSTLMDEMESLNRIMNSLNNSNYGTYLPQNEAIRNANIKLVDGVHSPFLTQKYEQAKESGSYSEAAKRVAKDMYDVVTAKSEKKRINECLADLAELKKNNQLPEHIILNGYSRGGSTCIKLARMIYLEYGDAIKIDMNIGDPVPGPLRHAKSRKVIPPNVRSLIITYAGEEKRLLFKPQNLHKIFYDKEKTTVTAIVLPLKHIGNTEELFDKIKQINQAFWHKVILGKSGQVESPTFYQQGSTYAMVTPSKDQKVGSTKYYKVTEDRKDRIQNLTNFAANADVNLNAFHQALNSGAQQVPQHPVKHKEQINMSADQRRSELDRIYNEGREALHQKKSIQTSAQDKSEKHGLQILNVAAILRDINEEIKKIPDYPLIKADGKNQTVQWIAMQKELNNLRIQARNEPWPQNKKSRALANIEKMLKPYKSEMDASAGKAIENDFKEKIANRKAAKQPITPEIQTPRKKF